MFVTPEIDDIARRPFPETIEGERYAELAATLDAFCEMSVVSVCETPGRKQWDVMLARVRPITAEFWSLRISEPQNTPGMRLLGGFCAKDEFVALQWEFREEIENFDETVGDVDDLWGEYFGRGRPFSGREVDDYLSNYYIL